MAVPVCDIVAGTCVKAPVGFVQHIDLRLQLALAEAANDSTGEHDHMEVHLHRDPNFMSLIWSATTPTEDSGSAMSVELQ